MSQNFKSTYQDYSGYTCISKSISIPCINTCTIHINKCNFSWNAFEIHISEFELKPKFASIIYVHLFYKYFIQLCILTFETILFSFNKKIDSEGILLKNSGVLQSWSISRPVLVRHINEVLDNLTSDPWETGSSRCRQWVFGDDLTCKLFLPRCY